MFKLKTAEIIDIQRIIGDIFGDDLHKKRQTSLAYTAMGLLESNSLFLHDMGSGMAQKRGTNKKHGIKQIDRMLSNPGFDIWQLSANWVPYVIGSRTELMVALDWTNFAGDDQHMLSLNILTSKGCSTPLLWRTVDKNRLKHNRGRYEDQILSRLKDVLPEGVSVTIVADRGFADRKFFEFIEQTLKFNYIIRIKANTTVKNRSRYNKKSI